MIRVGVPGAGAGSGSLAVGGERLGHVVVAGDGAAADGGAGEDKGNDGSTFLSAVDAPEFFTFICSIISLKVLFV